MSFLDARTQDFGLMSLKIEVNRLHICSQEPRSFADVATYSLGIKAVSLTGPIAGEGTARKVTVPAFADGEVKATGVATCLALVDTVEDRLWLTKEFS